MATNRETVRDALATLLTTDLTGAGNSAQAVYNYKVGDFAGQSPVVIVTSEGSERKDIVFSSPERYSIFYLSVMVFVLYADPDVSWTEADAEDRLDLIEKDISETLQTNYGHSSGTWHRIFIEGRTQVLEVTIAGDQYLVEIFPVRVEINDT